jgi:c-di-GMP-related signal transduction protein
MPMAAFLFFDMELYGTFSFAIKEQGYYWRHWMLTLQYSYLQTYTTTLKEEEKQTETQIIHQENSESPIKHLFLRWLNSPTKSQASIKHCPNYLVMNNLHQWISYMYVSTFLYEKVPV